MTAAGRAALAPPGLARMVDGAAAGSVRVVVSLPPREVLRRTITLPAAVEENLRQALTYDLDRHTPFKPEELYFDAASSAATRPARRADQSISRPRAAPWSIPR